MTSLSPSVRRAETGTFNETLWTHTSTAAPHLHRPFTCDFSELLNYLLLGFALWDGAHEQPVVGDRYTNADVFARANLMIVTLFEDRRKVHAVNLTSSPHTDRRRRAASLTSFTASWAASLVQNVTKA